MRCREASAAPQIGPFDKSRRNADRDMESRGSLNTVNDVSDAKQMCVDRSNVYCCRVYARANEVDDPRPWLTTLDSMTSDASDWTLEADWGMIVQKHMRVGRL
jgi:hypothetical protein